MLWLKFYSIILHIYFYGYCWNRAIDWHTSNLNTVINLRVIQQPTVNFYLWQDSVVRWGTEATSIFPKYFNSFRYDTWEALFWLFFMEIFIGTYHKKKYVLLNSSFIHSSFFPDDDIDLTRYVYLIREGIVLYSQDIRFTVYKFFLGIFFRFDITYNHIAPSLLHVLTKSFSPRFSQCGTPSYTSPSNSFSRCFVGFH